MSMCENRNGMRTLRHDVRSIAREASAAPAAKFKSRTRKLEIHVDEYGVNQDLELDFTFVDLSSDAT
jgi:hypothetical protein